MSTASVALRARKYEKRGGFIQNSSTPSRGGRDVYTLQLMCSALAQRLETCIHQRRIYHLVVGHVFGHISALPINLLREIEHGFVNAAIHTPNTKLIDLLNSVGQLAEVIDFHAFGQYFGRLIGMIKHVTYTADIVTNEDLQGFALVRVFEFRRLHWEKHVSHVREVVADCLDDVSAALAFAPEGKLNIQERRIDLSSG